MKHPERAVAMHFIYPAQLIPIVEICGGPQTAPEVVTWACDVMKAVGQTPALMNKEVDGFIINRLQFAVLREAWSMWANGIASAEAIDNSFKLSLGTALRGDRPDRKRRAGWPRHHEQVRRVPAAGSGHVVVAAQLQFPDLVKDGTLRAEDRDGAFMTGTARDGKALLAARADKLFQHMKDDAAKG